MYIGVLTCICDREEPNGLLKLSQCLGSVLLCLCLLCPKNLRSCIQLLTSLSDYSLIYFLPVLTLACLLITTSACSIFYCSPDRLLTLLVPCSCSCLCPCTWSVLPVYDLACLSLLFPLLLPGPTCLPTVSAYPWFATSIHLACLLLKVPVCSGLLLN